jgi:hypothetical protein
VFLTSLLGNISNTEELAYTVFFWRDKSGFPKCEKNMHAKVEHALNDKWTWMGRGCQLILLYSALVTVKFVWLWLQLQVIHCNSYQFLCVYIQVKIFRNLFCVVICSTGLRWWNICLNSMLFSDTCVKNKACKKILQWVLWCPNSSFMNDVWMWRKSIHVDLSPTRNLLDRILCC